MVQAKWACGLGSCDHSCINNVCLCGYDRYDTCLLICPLMTLRKTIMLQPTSASAGVLWMRHKSDSNVSCRWHLWHEHEERIWRESCECFIDLTLACFVPLWCSILSCILWYYSADCAAGIPMGNIWQHCWCCHPVPGHCPLCTMEAAAFHSRCHFIQQQ